MKKKKIKSNVHNSDNRNMLREITIKIGLERIDT